MVARFWKRSRYRFDNAISRGTLPIILWLLAAMLAIVAVCALLLTITRADIGDSPDPSFVESYWQTLLRTLDPGTFSGDAGWGVRIVSFIATIFGITVAAVLVGLIVTGIDSKVEELRRGRSPVVEADHTLVLGWSPRVFTIVSEIIEADGSRDDSAIVVLAAMEKREMEEAFDSRRVKTGKTRLVCRSGEPANLNDLERVAIDGARSVIVLADVDDADGDAQAVKTVLAALICLGERDVPVVVELNEAETAQALKHAGPDRVHVVRAPEIIARVTAQACRQPGLSSVWQDLLDFDGDEIYFFPADGLVGRTFGEALLGFERSSVIGRRAADGTVTVNPPPEVEFEAGDAVIVLAEDDDAIEFTGLGPPDARADTLPAAEDQRPEHVLLIGWNSMARTILTELDRFVPEASTVDVLADADLVPAARVVAPPLSRLTMTKLPAEKANLDSLAGQVVVKDYDVVLILGYRSLATAASADARTLLTLLLVQQAAPGLRVVTELLDSADIELALASGGDDYVVSDALSGYLMSQLAENPDLAGVFDALFEGTEVVLRLAPAVPYAQGATTFRDVVVAARTRGEIALGYFREDDADVVLNPPKSTEVDLGAGDRVVVITRT